MMHYGGGKYSFTRVFGIVTFLLIVATQTTTTTASPLDRWQSEGNGRSSRVVRDTNPVANNSSTEKPGDLNGHQYQPSIEEYDTDQVQEPDDKTSSTTTTAATTTTTPAAIITGVDPDKSTDPTDHTVLIIVLSVIGAVIVIIAIVSYAFRNYLRRGWYNLSRPRYDQAATQAPEDKGNMLVTKKALSPDQKLNPPQTVPA